MTEIADKPASNTGKFRTVALSRAVTRGDTAIDQITLREPNSGELRGLNLQDIYALDVGAILTILTRISEPVLTAPEAESLSPSDLMEIGGNIKDFFLTPGERAAMEQMLQTMTGQAPPSKP